MAANKLSKEIMRLLPIQHEIFQKLQNTIFFLSGVAGEYAIERALDKNVTHHVYRVSYDYERK